MAGLSLLVCAGASWWAFDHLGGPGREPSAWLTASVMVAGFALAAVAFHLLRVRAALAIRRRPVAPETIELHLGASRFPETALPGARAEALPGPD
jgi:hypothetical protein